MIEEQCGCAIAIANKQEFSADQRRKNAWNQIKSQTKNKKRKQGRGNNWENHRQMQMDNPSINSKFGGYLQEKNQISRQKKHIIDKNMNAK